MGKGTSAPVLSKTKHGQRGAHTGVFRCGFGRLGDGIISAVDCAGKLLLEGRDVAGRALCETGDHVDCDPAGDFPRGVTAHAVRDRENARAVHHDMGIFIGRPPTTYVGPSMGCDFHRAKATR